MIAHLYYLIISLILLTIALIWKYFFHKKTKYIFSSLMLIGDKQANKKYIENLYYLLKLLGLISISLALARIRVPDKRTKIPVEGIDIMLVLDVSQSMLFFDDLNDPQTRVEIAKKEALKFIEKRDHDAIGIVLFGEGIVSRCPLTLDKNMLNSLVRETEIGIVNPQGTFLSWGIITAANRLKNSSAKSKIMIVLTDGEPTQGDADPQFAIDLAKKMGIKIYTIGIGSEQGGYMQHPFFGLMRMNNKLNIPLLKLFSNATDGQFFIAQNSKELENIYKIIDSLERTENQKPTYAKYFEFFPYFLWIAFVLMFTELILSSYIWFKL